MAREIHGELKANVNWKVALIASRFNELITSKLVGGALDCLKRFGLQDDHVDLIWTPGAFEIPGVAKRVAKSGKYQGILCLGAVIRGSTPHFEFVAGEAAKGIAAVSLQSDSPVIYSVLTTDTIEQAIERAGTKAGNKGFDGAMSLVEMMSLYEKLG